MLSNSIECVIITINLNYGNNGNLVIPITIPVMWSIHMCRWPTHAYSHFALRQIFSAFSKCEVKYEIEVCENDD